MEGITNDDCKHAERVWKDFEVKHLGDYHDLYVQGADTFWLDTVEKCQNKCVETYEIEQGQCFQRKD